MVLGLHRTAETSQSRQTAPSPAHCFLCFYILHRCGAFVTNDGPVLAHDQLKIIAYIRTLRAWQIHKENPYQPLAVTNPFFFHQCFYSCAFSRMSFSWNCISGSLFRLASFTKQHIFKIPPSFCGLTAGFFLIPEEYSVVHTCHSLFTHWVG